MDVKLSLSVRFLISRVDKCDRNETEISKLSVVVTQLSQILSVLSF